MHVFTDFLTVTKIARDTKNQGQGKYKRTFHQEKIELQVQIRYEWKGHDLYYYQISLLTNQGIYDVMRGQKVR